MALEPGQNLAHYRIVRQIGQGGMGAVFLAEDTKLDRQVALKVLPPEMASDPDRLARFEREAKVLASLNHPNIAAIHGIEQAEGVRFLVLELVSGETLAKRIASGTMPPEEAIGVCRQIAEGLEAAHAQGILHRDLKPGNVMITSDGRVKVLDFGLAKTGGADPSSTSISMSPTVTVAGTQDGVILGTAPYMSPEQARGRALDRRSDVWSYGCVLYECLSGRPAFPGETVTDILGAILHREPDWAALPAETPPRAVRLLRRCLQKDPRGRLHDVADARIVLEEGEAPEPPAAARGAWRPGLPVMAGAALVLLALGFLIGRTLMPSVARDPGPTVRVRLDPLANLDAAAAPGPGQGLAISPDGNRLVYGLKLEDLPAALYLRELDTLEHTRIAGTEGAQQPFFSPDGEQIGFFSDFRLRVLQLEGGGRLDLAGEGGARGATWSEDGNIYFVPGTDAGLFVVPAGGGEAVRLAAPDPDQGQRTIRWPAALPGAHALLVTIGDSRIRSFDDAQIAVYTLEDGSFRTLIEGGSYPLFSPTGHVLYYSAGTVYAAPFDPATLQLTGRPRAVQQNVVGDPTSGGANIALAGAGVLAFVPGTPLDETQELVRVDRDGSVRPLSKRQGPFLTVTPSPDGRLLALTVNGANADIWVLDPERDALSRLTFEWTNWQPVWTPDGTRIVYARGRGGRWELFWVPVDGSAPPQLLVESEISKFPDAFSPDGRHLIVSAVVPGSKQDLWILSMEDREEAPFLQTPHSEHDAAFSPDGRWVAYVSDESGEDEIYVRPFPGPGAKWQVSVDGGSKPTFRADGKKLYFVGPDGPLEVDIEDSASGFRTGSPRTMIDVSPGELEVTDGAFLPDGSGAVVIRPLPRPGESREMELILNWRPPAP